MELVGLLNAMGYKPNVQTDGSIKIDENGTEDRFHIFCEKLERDLKSKSNNNGLRVLELLRQNKISIPKNLSIIATINTSDESIYYLDTAFKRRWSYEQISIESSEKMFHEVKLVIPNGQNSTIELEWIPILEGINEIIKNNYKTIKRIEDKQIGFWFIKPDDSGKIHLEEVQGKLMFYLWDSVFVRDKKPLETIISEISGNTDIKLITYDDFVKYTKNLFEYLYEQKAIDF
jgi:5-methylcytosine-specific restriction endonuclease McrBC GTP-binding regulatory subunit McrB